jgi:two-component system sensor histidine kinase/response regulator
MGQIISYLKRLMGPKENFTLEARIFHAVCLALIFCISVNIPIAFYLRIPQLAVLLSVVAGVAGILYYLSRFKGRHQLGAGLFQVFVHLALSVNYYYNSGIDGPTYTLFLLAFLVVVVTSPIRQYYLWLPLNLLLVAGLMSVEFIFPGVITETYADGKGRYIDFMFSYLFLAGFAFLVAAYVRKSFNQQRQELIDKSVALEAANATKNKLLSIIGHDLKEPLASLQSYLEILVDFDLQEEEQQQLKSELLTMTKNASVMLSNILLWAKGQMQSIEPELDALWVKMALESVLGQVERIGRNKQIDLHTHIPEDIIIMADQQMFELIVRNLLMNAIKFTPKGGNVWVTAHIENTHCVIGIKDDGVGIPDELQKHIFSLAVKSQHGTELERGAGLGLMLCMEFTELQGGTLNFESKAGKGSTFTLRFPLAPGRAGDSLAA